MTDTSGTVAVNLVATYKALGGGWEIREGKDFVPEETMERMRSRTDWGGLLGPEKLEPPPPEAESSHWLPPDW